MLADFEKQHTPCICKKLTVANERKPEKFEAEMNQPCPRHGLRNLGTIVEFRYAGEAISAKLDRLLEIYKARSPIECLRSLSRQGGSSDV
jgi:hypothetical protein